MKNKVITTALTSLVLLFLAYVFFRYSGRTVTLHTLKVGFLYESDESNPSTNIFIRAEEDLEEAYPRQVITYTRSNVPEEEVEGSLLSLMKEGCSIIFTNSPSPHVKSFAKTHPKVQFCQVSPGLKEGEKEPLKEEEKYLDNYHTFQAELYQARYLSGIIAGLKLQDLVETRVITPEAALLGYVASSPKPEVISGFTAFFLGVRHFMPHATMKVYYTGEENNYYREKACTEALIREGCQVISQHTNTIGPAMACEESFSLKKAYFIAYNQGMTNLAPSSCLASIAPNWTPYVQGAVNALMAGEPIEKMVPGNLHDENDLSAGFEEDWLQLIDINYALLPYAVQKSISQTTSNLSKNPDLVFSGDYLGVSPWDETDTWDLNTPYEENKDSSFATFHYILKDVITAEEFKAK